MIKHPLVKLGEVSEVTSSKRIYASDYVQDGVPFYRSKEIIEKHHNKDISTDLYIAEKKYHEIKDKFGAPQNGDLLITAVGTLGIPYIVVNKDHFYFKDGNLIWFRNLKGIESKYLYYWMMSGTGKSALGQTTIGSAQPAYTIANLKEVKLPLLPIKQQKKIAAILTAYDDLIEVNKRRIALLEKMAEELYREWFVRMRFPDHQNTRFVKGVPEGWKDTQLGKIAKFTMGQSPKSEFYNENGKGLPFHQGVGTYGERFPNTVTYCSVDGRRASKGDILFSVRAPVGRLNIAGEEMIIGRGLAAIKHNQGKSVYLYYLLKNTFSREDIIGNGAIFNSVGKDELSRFSVYGHPEELIDQYEEVAGPIDRQIENLIRSTKNLTQTRNLLLPRLISGKLPVEDLDIQFPPSMQEDASH